jgi:hypothetical protein
MQTELSKYSQHLTNALNRIFKKIPAVIIEAFCFALKNGGLLEHDFTRVKDASFNPRPARICLILINDARVTAADILASSLIRSGLEMNPTAIANYPELDHLITKLAEDSLQNPLALCNMAKNDNRSPGILAAASWLDRVRHFHLADNETLAKKKDEVLELNQAYTELSKLCSEPLGIMLVHWEKLFRRRC